MSRRSAMCYWHWGKSIVLINVFWEPFRMGGELLLSSLFARYMVCREPHFSSQVPPVTLTSAAGNHQSALQIYWYIRAVLICWLAPHSHRHNSWCRYRLYFFCIDSLDTLYILPSVGEPKYWKTTILALQMPYQINDSQNIHHIGWRIIFICPEGCNFYVPFHCQGTLQYENTCLLPHKYTWGFVHLKPMAL